MSPELIRTLVAAGLALLLAVSALTTRGQPYRRTALLLSALGMGLLAIFNLNQTLVPLSWAAVAAIAVAMVCYLLSWQKGEVLKRHEQMRAEMIEKAKKRREKLKR